MSTFGAITPERRQKMLTTETGDGRHKSAYESDLTARHIRKVAELLDGDSYYGLGIKLNFTYVELHKLATPPTGGPAQYAAWVLHKWRNEHANLAIHEVRKALVKALQASGRVDIAEDVAIALRTENNIEQVFQDISGKLTKDWRTVGINLGIPDDDLQAAKAYLDLQEEPALQMLQRWRQQRTLTHQRSQLIAALTELGLQNVIKAIEEIDQELLGQQVSSQAQHSSGYRSQMQTSGSAQTRQSSQLDQPLSRVTSPLGQQRQTSGRFSEPRETDLTPNVSVEVQNYHDSHLRTTGAASLPRTDVQTPNTAVLEGGDVNSKFEKVLKQYELDWFIDHDCATEELKETVADPEVTMSHKFVRERLYKEQEKIENYIRQMQPSYMGRVESTNKPFRCVLLGKTGDGKSSLGNLLTGLKVFGVGHSAKSETHTIQYCHTASLEVIDTPGLGGPNKKVDAEFEIAKIFETFKEGIHCFLYVFSMGNKHADDADVAIFKKIKDMLGEMMKTHCILVLTYPDETLCRGNGLRDYVASIADTNLREIFNIIGNRIIAVDNVSTGYKRELHREGVINMITESVHQAYQAGFGECYTPSFFTEAKNALEESKRKHREKIEAQEKETDRIVLDRLNKTVSTASVNRLLDLTDDKERKASLIETVIGSVPSGKEYARKEGMKMLKGLLENQLQRSFIELVNAFITNCNFSIEQYIEAIDRDNAGLVHAVGRQHVADTVGMRYRELFEKKMTEDRLVKLQQMEAAAAQAERESLKREARQSEFMEAQVKMYVTQNIVLHEKASDIVSRVLKGNPTFGRQKTQDLVYRFLCSGEGRALVDNHLQSVRDSLRRKAIAEMETQVRIGIKTFISNNTRAEMWKCKTNPTFHMKTTDEIIFQVKRGLNQEHLEFLSEADIRGSVIDSLNESINNVNNAGFIEKCKVAFSFFWAKEYTEKLMDKYVVDVGFGDSMGGNQTSESASVTKQTPQGQVNQLQLTTTENLPVVLDLEGHESSEVPSSTTDDEGGGHGDIADHKKDSMPPMTDDDETIFSLRREKKSAGLFFGGEGGSLQMPESDVILHVPPHAVPPGKVYVIHGTVHTDLSAYDEWMSSEEEYIVGPIAEYIVETGEVFDEAVEVVIPHCVPPDKTGNIRVLCSTGEKYRELSKDDSDITYHIEGQHVRIFPRHFTRFMVTNSGKEEEITDALLTIAASRKETKSEAITDIRLMLHSGCNTLTDFSDIRNGYYNPDMREIIRQKLVLPEAEDALSFPTINIELSVEDGCDGKIWKGKTPRKTNVKVLGKNVLRLPRYGQTRSETLANFSLDSALDQQMKCSMVITFDYKEESEPIIEEIRVVYPLDHESEGDNRDIKHEIEGHIGDLTYDRMKKYIIDSSAEIYQRLSLSPMLVAVLIAADVLGPADKNELEVGNLTKHKKIEIILSTIVQKGEKAFLDFCLALNQPKINQGHIVTNIMKLDMDYVHAQRELYGPLPTDQLSSSASASTSHLRGRRSLIAPAAVQQAFSHQPASSVRERAAASHSVPYSGIPRPTHRSKPTPSKQGSTTGKK